MDKISATELVRKTSYVLDRVRAHGESIAIERNNTVIAHIVPPTRTMTGAELLAILGPGTLTELQANSWLNDSQGPFSDEIIDPWK